MVRNSGGSFAGGEKLKMKIWADFFWRGAHIGFGLLSALGSTQKFPASRKKWRMDLDGFYQRHTFGLEQSKWFFNFSVFFM